MTDELLVLGSTSIPTRRRFSSAYAVRVTGRLFLVDCGAPVSTLLYRYDLDPMDVQAIFLSHWHMDHIANLGLLLSQNHHRKRPEPITIYGPRGTRGKVQRLLGDSFLSPEELNYSLSIKNVILNKQYQEALLTATFFKTQHLERPTLKRQFGRKAVACGMILDGPGWRIVYSGDVRSPTELAPYIKGCDLLIHEMSHHQPEAVAEFAEAAKIPHLLISHLDPKFDESPGKIRAAFANRYQGDLMVAEDGTRVGLSQIRANASAEINPPPADKLKLQPESSAVDNLVDPDHNENPNAIFVHILQKEFNLPRAVSHQILQAAKEVLVGRTPPGHLGQVGVVVASLSVPNNAPLTEMDRVEVTLTIDAGAEDAEVEIEEGVTGLRRGRILRLLEETIEQDAVLTQEDLAWILNVNVRTIRRDVQILKDEGHPIYTRGQLNADDEIQLYKARVVKMWLDQKTLEDIAHQLHHSLRAIKRYINLFLEVITLHQQGKSVEEITTVLPVSIRLVNEYLAISDAARVKPRWRTKLMQELTEVENVLNG